MPAHKIITVRFEAEQRQRLGVALAQRNKCQAANNAKPLSLNSFCIEAIMGAVEGYFETPPEPPASPLKTLD